MAPLHLLDKASEENTVEPELAPELVEELTDILERSGPKNSGRAYMYYSMPAAGVRYYGFDQLPSAKRSGQQVKIE